VRARIRAARGLPEVLIVAGDGTQWEIASTGQRLGPDIARTAMTCASAAVVTGGPALLAAMAWGTPCVTDTATARAIGARPGLHVLVGDDDGERRRGAESVAGDGVLAARLSWQGRRLVETHHSPDCAAAALVRRLGLFAGRAQRSSTPFSGRFRELGTPPDAVVVAHAAAATRSLTTRR
jgi:hypothetical protein